MDTKEKTVTGEGNALRIVIEYGDKPYVVKQGDQEIQRFARVDQAETFAKQQTDKGSAGQNCARLLDCGHFPSPHSDFTTGYGEDNEGKKHCYECCAKRDREQMIRDGKTTLYLTQTRDNGTDYPKPEVSNWPGSLRFGVYYLKTGRHNMAGKRYDAYFVGPDKSTWHGVTYGDNTQICHCKRVKA